MHSKEVALLFGTFVIAICGLVYELLAGTLSSYLLGDSIYHFSLVIGLFMSSMGVGAWLSRFIEENLKHAFVVIQFCISLLGGFSAFILFYAFAYLENYDAFLYLITILLGSMLGVEIPLIIRILKESFSLKTNISNVFTVDYIGALFASLLFPLILVPHLGLMQTSFLFGGLNLMVGTMAWYIFRDTLSKKHLIIIGFIAITLILGFLKSSTLTSLIENKLYQHNIIYSKQTPYQKLIVTGDKGRIQFYINGAIQFDTIDEYRYHESLVHPVMNMSKSHENILILGGGDGMALREVLKYEDVNHVTLIDLDPTITTLFKDHPTLSKLNKHAYQNPKVTVINQDAWKFIETSNRLYDVIIIDLPDPNSISLSRLYSQTFYRLLSSHLSRAGAMVTQATSPMFSRDAFWCIDETLKAADLKTLPYHTYIPSFGEWGFVLASKLSLPLKTLKPIKDLRYLDEITMNNMLYFDKNIAKTDVESNKLSTHKLIYYYDEGWEKWYAK
ncbi:MAG: Spermidine synthase (EC [uncultured Sulfurovum sp.]|uniref:Polyamine aminopropyltransferase n=1 Tax=uncultured Sulfurovum sp. TaxID=269237 RepID=A0A6S6S497_9BACT|nr:MAG: Spermidine synthase (EC [uncultured Sulfurovum sp.]